MPSLISPNVSVWIIDESFYVPGRAATVPVIFVATAEHKYQSDGETPALGTYEYGVVREVTSIRNSLELYGVPRFLVSASGEAHHGDARNEYGLDALNKFLEIGNRALVVRANVNLDDEYASIKALWSSEVLDSADYLNQLVSDFIAETNAVAGYIPDDVEYVESVTGTELKSLVTTAFNDTFNMYSFSSNAFYDGFILDHLVDQPGYQEVLFDTSRGFLQSTDVTGLNNDTTLYGADVEIENVTFQLHFAGSTCQTFGALLTQINSVIAGSGTADLLAGNIRITSALLGTTSIVAIEDGPSGFLPLFGSSNLFVKVDTAVYGYGSDALIVYDDTFTTAGILGEYTGLDNLIDTYNMGSVELNRFTPDEAEDLVIDAAAEYDNTKEFLNSTSLGANDAARRTAIVAALQGAVNDPGHGLDGESYVFNLAVCPGFWEVSDELDRLSGRIYDEIFWIGDSPFDRPPTGPNSIVLWAPYAPGVGNFHGAIYYPHGISSNIDGVDIMTSAASAALRVYAYSDLVGEQWFAPAGPRRGLCTFLNSVGYVTGALGGPTTWVEDYIDEGTRDSLYEEPKNVNPIIFKAGYGPMILGQKTVYGSVSALSDVNVSRLVKYIKRQLRISLFAYLMEPNDQRTRDQVKFAADGFLASLLDRRGLYDFATQCDETNNTPDRIDRKELWIDVAIKPTRAVEYIYVPVRVVATGADL
jgi:hypothetical protein